MEVKKAVQDNKNKKLHVEKVGKMSNKVLVLFLLFKEF